MSTLFVIGGGSGDVRAAGVASGPGAKVMLAEGCRSWCRSRSSVGVRRSGMKSIMQRHFRRDERIGNVASAAWSSGSVDPAPGPCAQSVKS
ncbi:hypothetical protein FJ946_20375 [Mesorhizobium sp. B2-4-7]|nr:hypothetical protein FJW11_25825 [Mesorhizobium sp. B3-1-1]TPJ40936.1 hypothetical protein FJ437_24855 [Mesorhizobium sp. B2-6-6]TPJ58950.1 hypothetical protein FJ443_25100 [Mesorhizobium sp. B2-6-1]TPJ63169.1 hypothetical protein FJ462_23885 [Mesorhizobium sp. B2-6-7]TPJ79565.1 hypothetical protein FJ422_24685 [Mesorhizobium sp. B2-6-3]TPJ93762.1 hypothetical protein FJ489_20915 [Mesorhizobium sp. B2-5-12]TPJ94240.1 hypothetical protein FJ491_26320 [Mesorhizobium sp. B2-5-10]TPK06580.1 h